MTEAAGELEALRQLKARYCRFVDYKGVESWRNVFASDVVVSLTMAVSTAGADPQTAPALERRSLPRDLREVRWFVADQEPAAHPNDPEDNRW